MPRGQPPSVSKAARDARIEAVAKRERAGRLPGDDRNADDPVRPSAHLEPTSTLGQLDREIQELLSDGPPLDPNDATRRGAARRPSDEDSVFRTALQPLSGGPPQEEVIPGDPTALGARGKRRRQNTEDESPVLRRGLLGV